MPYTLALFRAGSLPLAIENGRYGNPDRLFLLMTDCVFIVLLIVLESEKHFLLKYSLFDDIKFELVEECF
jgi:hypothetical protein